MWLVASVCLWKDPLSRHLRHLFPVLDPKADGAARELWAPVPLQACIWSICVSTVAMHVHLTRAPPWRPAESNNSDLWETVFRFGCKKQHRGYETPDHSETRAGIQNTRGGVLTWLMAGWLTRWTEHQMARFDSGWGRTFFVSYDKLELLQTRQCMPCLRLRSTH